MKSNLACGEQTHFSALVSPAELFSRRVKQEPKNASAPRRQSLIKLVPNNLNTPQYHVVMRNYGLNT